MRGSTFAFLVDHNPKTILEFVGTGPEPFRAGTHSYTELGTWTLPLEGWLERDFDLLTMSSMSRLCSRGNSQKDRPERRKRERSKRGWHVPIWRSHPNPRGHQGLKEPRTKKDNRRVSFKPRRGQARQRWQVSPWQGYSASGYL